MIYVHNMYIIINVRIIWDEHKNRKNKKKHGIWFEDAQRVFDDPNHKVFFDSDHSAESEDRFIIIGMTDTKILVISYAEYDADDLVKIISARKAEPKEENFYYER